MIHSVDQLPLACALDSAAAAAGRRVDILLQVNPAGEVQKGGVSLQELPRLYEACMALPSIRVRGLMCMAPLTEDEKLIHGVFAKARRAFDELRSGDPCLDTLSMGMSGDAHIALQEGSTLVRIGTSLFGKRSL